MALAALIGALSVTAASSALDVRVRGGTKITAVAKFLADARTLEIRAKLVDEDGKPIERAWTELRASFELALRDVGGCPSPRISVAPLAGGVRAQTAARGELCLRLAGLAAKGTITLLYPGDAYHAHAEQKLAFDRDEPLRVATALSFEPAPTELDLDVPKSIIGARIATDSRETETRAGLEIRLLDESARVLGVAQTSADGSVRFEIPSELLGAPGLGRMRAEFAGNGALAPSNDDEEVTRFRTVRLALERHPDAVERGGTVEFAVLASALRSHADGAVEIIRLGASVVSAPIRDGRAVLEAYVDPSVVDEASFKLRYLPASPYFRAGEPLEVRVPVRPPSSALRGALGVLVGLAAAWVLWGWKRSKDRPAPTAPQARPLAPGVHVIDEAAAIGRFHGVVLDAHEGVPLAKVELIVHSPTLTGDGTILRTTSSENGSFSFELGERADAVRLETHAAHHRSVTKSLPSGGRLVIALATRRRALLERMVEWARRAGAPFERIREPTPEQVMLAASTRDDVREWASELEHAAYGPEAIDATTESRIERHEPSTKSA
ncbi:MAG: hypothetical protein EXR75_08310 [Myxococcales bacterium]|nr:hypothetical protein [Myxococcales bacterium]